MFNACAPRCTPGSALPLQMERHRMVWVAGLAVSPVCRRPVQCSSPPSPRRTMSARWLGARGAACHVAERGGGSERRPKPHRRWASACAAAHADPPVGSAAKLRRGGGPRGGRRRCRALACRRQQTLRLPARQRSLRGGRIRIPEAPFMSGGCLPSPGLPPLPRGARLSRRHARLRREVRTLGSPSVGE